MYERKYSGVNDRKAYPVDIVAFKDGDDVSYLNVENGELKLNGNPVGGGVTSWNDLQDRPFYAEGGMVEILPETQAVSMGDDGFALMDAIYGVEVNGDYTVTYNGVDYDCTGYSYRIEGIAVTFVALGNVAQLGLTGGNSEPFVMMLVPPDKVAEVGAAAQILPLDGATSVTVSISGREVIIHKLAQKYLDIDEPVVLTIDEAFDVTCDYSPRELLQMVNGNNMKEFILESPALRMHCKSVTVTVAGDSDFGTLNIIFMLASDTSVSAIKVMAVATSSGEESFSVADVG